MNMRYKKQSLVCLTLLYVLQTEVGGTSGPVPKSYKKNVCEIIINDLLLLAISTKNIELVLYASEMFRFI